MLRAAVSEEYMTFAAIINKIKCVCACVFICLEEFINILSLSLSFSHTPTHIHIATHISVVKYILFKRNSCPV